MIVSVSITGSVSTIVAVATGLLVCLLADDAADLMTGVDPASPG